MSPSMIWAVAMYGALVLLTIILCFGNAWSASIMGKWYQREWGDFPRWIQVSIVILCLALLAQAVSAIVPPTEPKETVLIVGPGFANRWTYQSTTIEVIYDKDGTRTIIGDDFVVDVPEGWMIVRS